MSGKLSYRELSEQICQVKGELDKKELEVDRLKNSFLANISHEIRTPMNAIVGFSNLISDPNYNNTQKKFFIDEINKNSKELLRLIDKILLTASAESELLKLNLKFFDPDEIIDKLYAEFYKILKERNMRNINLQIKKIKNKEKIKLHSDPDKLFSAIHNLIENSIKYTSKGTVEFGYKIIAGNKLQFFVNDTGEGIEETNFKLVFKHFNKLNKSEINNDKGLGLGLSLSDKIIKLLGGKLAVKSTLGKGSIFYFELPRLMHKTI